MTGWKKVACHHASCPRMTDCHRVLSCSCDCSSAWGTPARGLHQPAQEGLGLTWDINLFVWYNQFVKLTHLWQIYVWKVYERYLGCSGGPEGRFISKTSTMSSSGAFKKEIFRIAKFDKKNYLTTAVYYLHWRGSYGRCRPRQKPCWGRGEASCNKIAVINKTLISIVTW